MKSFDLSSYGGSRVVVVIPARNEECTIGSTVEASSRFAHAVYVADGHSTDATRTIAEEQGAVVFLDPGKGKGSGIRHALETVDADVVVFIDADGSHDPADIPSLALPVCRDETDLCIGDRFAGGSEELSVSFGQLIRTLGNISMNVAINARWKTQLADTLNGFRAVRRYAAIAACQREVSHTIEQEMVMKFLHHGYRVLNVPSHEYPRAFGDSHIRIWREWPLFVWCVARNILRRGV